MDVLGLIPARGGSKGIRARTSRRSAASRCSRGRSRRRRRSRAHARRRLHRRRRDRGSRGGRGPASPGRARGGRHADARRRPSRGLGARSRRRRAPAADVAASPRQHVDACVRLLLESGADAVVSVVEVPHRFRPDSLMDVVDGRVVARGRARTRQEKEPVYARNGPAVLARRADRVGDDLYGGDVRPFVIDVRDSLDVDDAARPRARGGVCSHEGWRSRSSRALACSTPRSGHILDLANPGGAPGRARLRARRRRSGGGGLRARRGRALPADARTSSRGRIAGTASFAARAAGAPQQAARLRSHASDAPGDRRRDGNVSAAASARSSRCSSETGRAHGGVELERALVERPARGRIHDAVRRDSERGWLVGGALRFASRRSRRSSASARGHDAGADQARHRRAWIGLIVHANLRCSTSFGRCSSSSTTGTSARRPRSSSASGGSAKRPRTGTRHGRPRATVELPASPARAVRRPRGRTLRATSCVDRGSVVTEPQPRPAATATSPRKSASSTRCSTPRPGASPSGTRGSSPVRRAGAIRTRSSSRSAATRSSAATSARSSSRTRR